MDHILFIQSSVDGHLSCFYFLAVLNSNTLNICIKYSFEYQLSILWGIYLQVGSLSQMVILCGCTILSSHQRGLRDSISRQHLLFPPFLFKITAILLGVQWYLIVGLSFRSLMTNDDVHLFTCWSFVYLWRNISSSPLPVFELGYIFVVKSSLCILDNRSLSGI